MRVDLFALTIGIGSFFDILCIVMDDIKTPSTDLFSKPSFLKGASRVVDLFGTLDEYNYRDDADSHAIAKDWKMVGLDISDSVCRYGTNQSR